MRGVDGDWARTMANGIRGRRHRRAGPQPPPPPPPRLPPDLALWLRAARARLSLALYSPIRQQMRTSRLAQKDIGSRQRGTRSAPACAEESEGRGAGGARGPERTDSRGARSPSLSPRSSPPHPPPLGDQLPAARLAGGGRGGPGPPGSPRGYPCSQLPLPRPQGPGTGRRPQEAIQRRPSGQDATPGPMDLSTFLPWAVPAQGAATKKVGVPGPPRRLGFPAPV